MSTLAQAFTYMVAIYATSLPALHAYCSVRDRRRLHGRKVYPAGTGVRPAGQSRRQFGEQMDMILAAGA